MTVAQIREGRRDNLSVSEDTDFDNQPIAVLLFVPDMEEHDHHHIELDRDQATKLMSWLRGWLEETSR